ncbi:MAG: cation:proton antiporter [Alistipes sp.]|nr:cation:proton antiporter [Candidatus Minthomonas equi]
MESNLNFVSDLALIFIAAGFFTIIAKWLKQPLILGYIVAGFLVGPNSPLGISLTSGAVVHEWSEIGIIFLLFGLGLEFSFKKLLNVGASALIIAVSYFTGMYVVGVTAGLLMGWSSISCVFLGGMLSMTSSTIILKAYEEMGLKKAPFAGLVFGTLIIEDIIGILLMVMLSTVAVSQKFEGLEMLMKLAELGFFLVLCFLVGIYVIPSILRRAHSVINDEMLLVLSVGLCFGMVMLADLAGFSSALGAFVMGSLLSETLEGERITISLKPVKDVFGAVFFVSVGMMVNPAIMLKYWSTILVITLLVMFFMPFFAIMGGLVARKGLNLSVHVGMSKGLLGEFALIIAALGTSLKVLDEYVYAVMVAVSVITPFCITYFIKSSDAVSFWLGKHIPQRILNFLNPNTEDENKGLSKSEWMNFLKGYLIRVVVYSVLLFAILLFFRNWLFPEALLLGEKLKLEVTLIRWLSAAATVLVMSPFIAGLLSQSRKMKETFKMLWSDSSRPNKGPLIALVCLRLYLAVFFTIEGMLLYFRPSFWTFLVTIISAGAIALLSRRDVNRFRHVEEHFFTNLSEKEEQEKVEAPITSDIRSKLSGHDIHIETVTVSQNSRYAGMALRDIPIRAEFGVNIVKIIRGRKVIVIPSANECVYPLDRIVTIGTKEQIDRFMAVMEEDANMEPSENVYLPLDAYVLGEKSYLTDKSLKFTDMRSHGCMLVGVVRGRESIMNPSPDFVFRAGDVVWMVGEREQCQWFA